MPSKKLLTQWLSIMKLPKMHLLKAIKREDKKHYFNWNLKFRNYVKDFPTKFAKLNYCNGCNSKQLSYKNKKKIFEDLIVWSDFILIMNQNDCIIKLSKNDFKEIKTCIQESTIKLKVQVSENKEENYLIFNNIKTEQKIKLKICKNLNSSLMQILIEQLPDQIKNKKVVQNIFPAFIIPDASLKRENEVLLQNFQSQSDQGLDYLDQDFQTQKVHNQTRAIRTQDPAKRAKIRHQIIKFFKQESQMSSIRVKERLEAECGICEPKNSIEQMLNQICEGTEGIRRGIKYRLKQQVLNELQQKQKQ